VARNPALAALTGKSMDEIAKARQQMRSEEEEAHISLTRGEKTGSRLNSVEPPMMA
jgi:hypothetical protein